MCLNVLFVSIAFPPKNDPEAIQAARYFKFLQQDKRLRIDVVTSKDPTLFMPADESLLPYAQGSRQLIKLPIYEYKYSNAFIRRVFPSLLKFPDSKFSFAWHEKEVLRKIKHKPDIIYSRSFPLSTSFLAFKLSLLYKVPWVMHLSDPWVESPLHTYKGRSLNWNRFHEEKLFSHASVITFTSPRTKELYISKYPQFEEKFHISPNVYDGCELRDILDVGNYSRNHLGQVKFVYTGGLANTRDAMPILKAIHYLNSYSPDTLKKAKFIFAGPMDRRNEQIFKTYAHPSVTHLGALSASAAKTLQKEADVLLLLDSIIPGSRYDVFFPSKLLDYLVAAKPILAVTGESSYSREFLKQLKVGTAHNFSDVEGIAAQIRNIVERGISWEPDLLELEKFSSSSQTKILIELFHKIVANGG